MLRSQNPDLASVSRRLEVSQIAPVEMWGIWRFLLSFFIQGRSPLKKVTSEMYHLFFLTFNVSGGQM